MTLHPTWSYDRRFAEALDAVMSGLSRDLSRAAELPHAAADRVVALILEHACQCQNARNIALGREAAVELPRGWLLSRIERVAERTLDLGNDDWEFRRLLEVAELLDRELLSRLVRRGLASSNPGIVEAADDFGPDQGG